MTPILSEIKLKDKLCNFANFYVGK